MSQMIISTEASLEPATSDARPQVNIDELSVDQLRKLVSKQSAQLAQFHYNEVSLIMDSSSRGCAHAN